MLVSHAVEMFLDYHRANSSASTVRNYTWLLSGFAQQYGDRDLQSVKPDDILSFLNQNSEGKKRSTKKLRYTLMVAFFNFLRSTVDQELHNPCDSLVLRKMFRASRPVPWKIVEKEAIDEMVFRTPDSGDRLMLELMARGGLRIGEVLKLRVERMCRTVSSFSMPPRAAAKPR